MSNQIDHIYQIIHDRKRLSAEDGLFLFENADLLSLGFLANKMRMNLHPDKMVTYIIDRNINYTNICVAHCDFCAFYEKIGSDAGYVLKRDEIAKKIEETINLGGTQILMQGGLNPALKIDFLKSFLVLSVKNIQQSVSIAYHRQKLLIWPKYHH